ncbi:MAG: XRE family transcriptional regulator [Chitinophagaceae bacterium]|nr:MAG: XRE family transcriptional regulator [Chitinophagaceae bacterium]
MGERIAVLLPRIQAILESVGENIRLARLRRKLTMQQISERAGINRTTLWHVEKGTGGVSLAAYAQVLLVLGLEKDLLQIASDDEMGRRIQDTNLIVKKRAPKR